MQVRVSTPDGGPWAGTRTRAGRSRALLAATTLLLVAIASIGLTPAAVGAEEPGAVSPDGEPSITSDTADPANLPSGPSTDTTVVSPAPDTTTPTTVAEPAAPTAPEAEVAPANDAFASPEMLVGASGTRSGSNVGATKEAGEPDHAGDPGGASVWFAWTAPADGVLAVDTCADDDFDTLLAVYAGATLGTLDLVGGSDDACGDFQSAVEVEVVSGVTYRIAIDGFQGVIGVGTGTYELNWDLGPPPPPGPANDAFDDAEPIAGSSGSVSGTNVGATTEPGEPDHGIGSAASVWYRWTATADEVVAFDTCTRATFDTVLAVYTGASVGSLELVGQNDDACSTASMVTISVAAGTTYSIAIDGFVGAVGDFVLQWGQVSPPPNDDFDDAQTLVGPSGEESGTTRGATIEPDEPSHAGNPGMGSVWYRWTAPASGTLAMDTCQGDLDTLLGIYTGTTVGSLELVAANDDSCELQSEVEATVVAGTTYMIAVDDFRYPDTSLSTQGPFTLAWVLDAPDDGGDHGSPSPYPLARTGADSLSLTLVALGLVALGVVSLAVSRRLQARR